MKLRNSSTTQIQMNRLMKYASLLLAAVMLVSCAGTTDDNSGGGEGINGTFRIEPDKTLLQSDGVDFVTLNVTLDGKPVTEDVTFYIDADMLPVENFRFSTTKAGDYEIWANYGTYNSEPVTIRAISVPIPEVPADPAPANTDFKSRVMCMQFTGTGCSYCSEFMKRLRPAFEDEAFADEYVKAAIHNYQYTESFPDAAFIQWSWATQTLGATNPSIIMDYELNYALYLATTSSEEFMGVVREQNNAKKDAACGIAVNAVLEGDQVVARVTVKAAESGSYRVGAMLLEDGIYGKQIAGEDWMNTHDKCVRYIDASYRVGNRDVYYGHSLGNIEKGKTADYLFIWNLEDIWNSAPEKVYWKKFVKENMHMAVFVTSAKGESYVINNAVSVEFNTPLAFEYK